MRTISRGLLGAGALGLAVLAPAAASAQAADWTQGWESRLILYGWLPGITGSQERPDGRPIVDLDTPSVLEALDFAFMAAGETRRDRLGFLFDFDYARLSQNGEWLRERLETETKTDLTMSTAAVTYRLYEAPAKDRFVDVYGGIRAYDVSLSFSIDSPRFGRDLGADANWVDALVGLRGEVPLGRGFSVSGFADAGGFGIGESSDLTWEAYAGVNYDFSDRWRALLGYRYMSIDYSSSDLTMDVDIYGPLLGVGFSF
jgi:opacity protein-like surface antigen